MGEVIETLPELRSSLAAPIVFVIAVAFEFFSRWLEQLKRGGGKSATATRLRGEIKDILKEASSLSLPSTFAQAVKLRRIAAAKEKELANCTSQELHGKEIKLSYDVLTYVVLVCWFWRVPVASISEQLVRPFGKVIPWRAGGVVNENVMVGIIPWLILSTRVSKFVCRLAKF
ncbi:protein GET1-like [Pyrus communis]|uniref:protein GET1-like n=1 Tax=Pyrus communis TaxID=23211 RepID=UPI0035C2247A